MTDQLTREIPHDITPQRAALEAIAHTREAALFMHSAAEKLLEISEAQNTPPEYRAVLLSAAAPVATDRSKWEAKSIAVLNPTSIRIYIGVGGNSASAAGRSPSVPPNTLMVLPIRDYDVELGVDPADQGALAAGTAVVFLFRYQSVQAAYAAKVA
jgi:hypothetical protein